MQQGVKALCVVWNGEGAFDGIVLRSERISVSILPYPLCRRSGTFSPKRDEFDTRDYSETMLPKGIETVHPRFATSWRNKWMIKQSDYVVTYVTHPWGGAAQFAEMAKKQKKIIVSLS